MSVASSTGTLALGLGCLLAGVLAGCAPGDDATFPGTLERERLELAADATETVVDLPVREGQRVAKGALILAQDASISAAQLEQARARLAAATSRLDELVNGPRSTTVAAARARRDGARSTRDDAVRELARLRGLVADKLVSASAVDQQSAAAENAEASLRAAEADLRELQEGTRPEEVEQARRAVDQARAALAELETSSSRLEVRAPRDAIVDALPFRVGEKPARGATVAVLLETGPPFARIHVPEPLRARVRVGDPATVRIDGVKGVLNGRVRYVSTEAEFTPYYSLSESDRSRLAYRTEVELPGPEAADLPAGLPLEVTLRPAGAE